MQSRFTIEPFKFIVFLAATRKKVNTYEATQLIMDKFHVTFANARRVLHYVLNAATLGLRNGKLNLITYYKRADYNTENSVVEWTDNLCFQFRYTSILASER
jgi:hypothetical protein